MVVTNINDFKNFVFSQKDDLNTMNGQCNFCPKKALCLADNKTNTINSILSLEKDDTRFAFLLEVVKHNKWMLKLVPAKLYKKIYGWYTDNLPCPFFAQKIIESIDKIEDVYNMLSDESSKRAYLNVLMYRLTFEREYVLSALSEEHQYFIPEFSGLGCDEVFVDCGAYTGDTLEDFIAHNQIPKKCYLFEPDSNNANKLKHVIKNKNIEDRSTVIEKGVYKCTTKLWFVSGKGSASFFTEEEVEKAVAIDVVSIDDSVDEPATFIKMDVEGFEKVALKGAENQLKQNAPKLAICVYHSVEDFWEIPLIIKEAGKYKNFKFRHYTDNFRESVFYAF